MTTSIPRSVVEMDHQLEAAHNRASEELAQHRWHWTLDESNPERVAVREYARAVGRNPSMILRYAKGYALFRERQQGGETAALTIQDAIRQADRSVENQQFAEAIAEGWGRPIAQVARGTNRIEVYEVVAEARDRAERYGTDPVDEARQIAERQRTTSTDPGAATAEREARAEVFFEQVAERLVRAGAPVRLAGEAMAAATDLAETDPGAWESFRAAALVETAAYRLRSHLARRRHAAMSSEATADDELPPAPYAARYALPDNTWLALGRMRPEDLLAVAGTRAALARANAIEATFLRLLADRIPPGGTVEAFVPSDVVLALHAEAEGTVIEHPVRRLAG